MVKDSSAPALAAGLSGLTTRARAEEVCLGASKRDKIRCFVVQSLRLSYLALLRYLRTLESPLTFSEATVACCATRPQSIRRLAFLSTSSKSSIRLGKKTAKRCKQIKTTVFNPEVSNLCHRTTAKKASEPKQPCSTLASPFESSLCPQRGSTFHCATAV